MQTTQKGVATLVKPSNTKGAAFLHVIYKLVFPARKVLSMLNVSITSGPTSIREHLKCVPRGFKLCRSLAYVRGVGLCTSLRKVSARRQGRQFRGLFRVANLTPFTRHLTKGLSNNVGRGLKLTYALIQAPRLLVLSRPATNISPLSQQRL